MWFRHTFTQVPAAKGLSNPSRGRACTAFLKASLSCDRTHAVIAASRNSHCLSTCSLGVSSSVIMSIASVESRVFGNRSEFPNHLWSGEKPDRSMSRFRAATTACTAET